MFGATELCHTASEGVILFLQNILSTIERLRDLPCVATFTQPRARPFHTMDPVFFPEESITLTAHCPLDELSSSSRSVAVAAELLPSWLLFFPAALALAALGKSFLALPLLTALHPLQSLPLAMPSLVAAASGVAPVHLHLSTHHEPMALEWKEITCRISFVPKKGFKYTVEYLSNDHVGERERCDDSTVLREHAYMMSVVDGRRVIPQKQLAVQVQSATMTPSGRG